MLEAIDQLKDGDALFSKDVLLAFKAYGTKKEPLKDVTHLNPIEFDKTFTRIVYPEDIFKNNDEEIRNDFKFLTAGRTSADLSSTNQILGDNIFLEAGVSAECSILNTTLGPVYLGKNSTVLEGSIIRGSFALGEYGLVKMGAKIYGRTTVGPYSKVGGRS